ncbi:AraC family transcriptional regulator [Nocardioides bizhenqiangii]|uniref:AraC family transcriptional regulator n=1 Tax=Nocardioides bizhenqiangii TaxID=3095076 RepID=A0ABZ0ZNE8_9ACTN|nr:MULTISPECIES: AraC family transcriptional regulator [unclassified Nocardioides]MDZ5621355.1 AraC family transcriptional regulator [Nocardioides sp. HM23]WQQ25805.1 AraC family transcriptional regulator [Nocardioides sp. HM61]
MAAPPARVRAWRPDVPGVAEVLHAHFPDHAYPMHTHDTWTVLIVDVGTVRYDLERQEHSTARSRVTLLPPYVAHDGRSTNAGGFRKRVLYLEPDAVDVDRLGRAVDRPEWSDPPLRAAVDRVHRSLAHRGEELEAEVGLALVTERLRRHLAGVDVAPGDRRDSTLARHLRELLDAHVVDGITLEEAAAVLAAEPAVLVRAFRRETGIPPHRYLTGRRIDLARRRLLNGERAADVAVSVGFYDQAHLTRHFRRLLGVTPGAYAASA